MERTLTFPYFEKLLVNSLFKQIITKLQNNNSQTDKPQTAKPQTKNLRLRNMKLINLKAQIHEP